MANAGVKLKVRAQDLVYESVWFLIFSGLLKQTQIFVLASRN